MTHFFKSNFDVDHLLIRQFKNPISEQIYMKNFTDRAAKRSNSN